MLDNNDFTRLNLTTKMIKTIQKFQKLVENDLVVEELDEQVEEEMTIEHKIEPPTENKLPISLEKVCIYFVHVSHNFQSLILFKYVTGQYMHRFLPGRHDIIKNLLYYLL